MVVHSEENGIPILSDQRGEINTQLLAEVARPNSEDIWVSYHVPQPTPHVFEGNIFQLKQAYQCDIIFVCCYKDSFKVLILLCTISKV